MNKVIEIIATNKFKMSHKDNRYYILVRKIPLFSWDKFNGLRSLCDIPVENVLPYEDIIIDRVNNFQYK
jgi:hypothetical protein